MQSGGLFKGQFTETNRFSQSGRADQAQNMTQQNFGLHELNDTTMLDSQVPDGNKSALYGNLGIHKGARPVTTANAGKRRMASQNQLKGTSAAALQSQ